MSRCSLRYQDSGQTCKQCSTSTIISITSKPCNILKDIRISN